VLRCTSERPIKVVIPFDGVKLPSAEVCVDVEGATRTNVKHIGEQKAVEVSIPAVGRKDVTIRFTYLPEILENTTIYEAKMHY
jgi:hypothetical protein